jgi:hypothetical protein
MVHLGNGNGNGHGNGETDEMIYLSIRRSIRELFGRFGEIIQALSDNTEIKVRNIQAVINNLVEHYCPSEIQKSNILMVFGAEPEHDKYGIALPGWRGRRSWDDLSRTCDNGMSIKKSFNICEAQHIWQQDGNELDN